ncbi:MAG: hypothetical protein ACJ72K_15505 [Friedmanniella sp.]
MAGRSSRHPTGAAARPSGPVLNRRWQACLLLLLAVFAGLRVVHALAERPEPVVALGDQVVVVGVAGRDGLTDVDRKVIGDHLRDAQVGAVNVRSRYLGACAAAGWTTLGAGRRAGVAGLCDPEVEAGRVLDWPERQAAAAARRGDAQLGLLEGSVAGCVAAVGPGAALAAASADGTLDDYRTVQQFLAEDLRTSCPLTLVDAGAASDEVITRLAADPSRTLLVTGVGPAAASDDPSLQVLYRLGAAVPGWLTSASTRRDGIVTLTDLTRTLIDHDRPAAAPVPVGVDGAPLAVQPAPLRVVDMERRLAATAALSDASPTGYLILGAYGCLLAAVLVVGALRRRWAVARLILTVGTVLSVSMMLTGSVPWPASPQPGLVLGLTVVIWSAVLTMIALVLGRRLQIPAAIAAAALTVAGFTADAALGGPLQPGSMLNSRPIYGLRWYGFGNVTFAAYATAGLLLAGYVAHRFLLAGRRRAAVVAVAVIGFGIVLCEGWPSMGTDFGGVVALTPPVLWLLLVLSGVRLTWLRLLLVGGSAVAAIAVISLLDWSRGPDRRSHLGNFVQRVLDGDALDVVSRKAVAAGETILSPAGLVCAVLGIVCWLLMFRYAVPMLAEELTTLRPVLTAILATAVLGTLLNDGGISVWLTVTSAATVTVAWFCVDRLHRLGWPSTAPARDGWTLSGRTAARR